MDLTRTNKVGPNEPCPCGSGKKYKKCCRDVIAAQSYTQQDRITALRRLDEYIARVHADEEDEAYHDLWGRFVDRADQLPAHFTAMSNDVMDAWFAFDRVRHETGKPVVDDFMLQVRDLSAGERAFLTMMRRTTMRLYEVVDVVPGVSLTLRDALDGTSITVHERSGSKTIARNDWLAARISPHGPSGRPEVELGLLPVPHLYKDAVLGELREMYEAARAEARGETFYDDLPPFFHGVWAGAIFEPAIPELRNTDGELLVETRVTFDVLDATQLIRALASVEGISGDDEHGWTWSGENRQGKPTSLGQLVLAGRTLVLECSSVERGARGRALLESLGEVIRHRVTTHADLQQQVGDRLTSQLLSGEEPDAPEPTIPSHVQEALVLGYYGKHYRAWIDEPVPALDGLTPRAAARDPRRRNEIADLIRGIESMYVQALRRGEPAYDPSWMWRELGLIEAAVLNHPPPLPHERVADMIAESGALVSAVAARLRTEADFDPARSIFTEQQHAAALDVQRFLRGKERAENESGGETAFAAPYLRLMINFELHRRKAFWVDESLAYMLGSTDIDLPGTELRVPFPSFALVFTDRHVLSLAERVVARDKAAALSGHLLRIVTVYVTEEARGDERALTLCITCDALGSDLPHLVRHTLSTGAAPLQASLDAIAPLLGEDAELADVDPLRGLVRIVINAILYATSAQVRPERKSAPRAKAHSKDRANPTFSSEEVYFLPGAIEISHVRKLQELERAPGGRVALRRFMVRGHWRRPAKNWEDQALRWVQPYWKGPSMAAVIERTYRMS